MAKTTTTKSRLFNTVKRYYQKYYSKDDVKKFVLAGQISTEEYKEITGEEYK